MPQLRRCDPMTRRAAAPGREGAPPRWIPPILQQLRGYRPEWLQSDLLAGPGRSPPWRCRPRSPDPAIVGVPPEVGLYAAIFPTIAYAIFGSSRQPMVGPDSATCLVLASALLYPRRHGAGRAGHGGRGAGRHHRRALHPGGAARLGFIADFLFTAGAHGLSGRNRGRPDHRADRPTVRPSPSRPKA